MTAKKIIETIKQKKPTIGTLLIIISIGIFLYAGSYCLYFDSDGYFITATGKYIVENGMPKYNPFTVAEMPFVCQQWLWCIWIYLTGLFGTAGRFAASAGLYIILVIIIYRLFRKKSGKTVSVFLAALLTSPCLYYVAGVRPQSITLILLFAQIIATERYFKNREKKWLICLPVIMLVEANAHISMCVMHLLIFLPYCVPLPNSAGQRVFKKHEIPTVIIVFLSMTAVMFINPYGADGVLYLIRAFTSDTFSVVTISEMQNPKVLSMLGAVIIIQILLFIFLIKKHSMNNVTAYLSAGLMFLEALYVRNIMFAPIIGWALCSDLLNCCGEKINDMTHIILPDAKIVIPFITAVIAVLMCIYLRITTPTFYDEISDIADWLDENVEKDTHIYTGFNTGGYLEYRGYTKLFMDSRPEVYNVPDTKSGLTYLEERHIFGFGTDSQAKKLYTYEELEEILEPYDFDYFVIQLSSDIFLGTYLASDDRYEIVNATDDIILFKRSAE